jgi:hypothetical protein
VRSNLPQSIAEEIAHQKKLFDGGAGSISIARQLGPIVISIAPGVRRRARGMGRNMVE